MVEPLEEPLGGQTSSAVVERRGAIEHHQRQSEDGTADDVPDSAVQARRSHEGHEPSHAQHEAETVGERVDDLLLHGVVRRMLLVHEIQPRCDALG